MHIGSLMIYDPSLADGGKVPFRQLLESLEKRLHLARAFRERIVRVPLGLDHPYWINDPDFDLEYHVRHVGLPAPGDWEQLTMLVARLHSRPLDLERPLWEFTVIDGLDNVAGVPRGCFAIASKVHHAAIDGLAGVEIAAAIHDLEPDGQPSEQTEPWNPEPLPAQMEMLTRAGVNSLRQPLRLSKLIKETAPAIRAARNEHLTFPTAPGDVPKTRFSGKVSSHRVFDARSFSFEDLRTIRSAIEGATVNDVVLSVCGGALRRYLDGLDELPEASLVAMAPVSVRSVTAASGNEISNMSVPLRTDIADPMERLDAIRDASSKAKELTEAIGARLLADAAESIPSVTMAMASRLYSRMSERMAPFNCVVSNVPGPQFKLYSAGAELVTFYGFGPVVDGLGLFIPVFSYDGRLTIAVTSCREMMPDPNIFADGLQASFDDLLRQAKKATKPRASKKKLDTKVPVKSKASVKKTVGKKSKTPATKKAAAKKAATKKVSEPTKKKAVAKATARAAKKRSSKTS